MNSGVLSRLLFHFSLQLSPNRRAGAPDSKQMQILFLLFSELRLGLGQRDIVFFLNDSSIFRRHHRKRSDPLWLTARALIRARLPEVVPSAVVPINLNIVLAKRKKKIQLIYFGCVAWSEMLALALAV